MLINWFCSHAEGPLRGLGVSCCDGSVYHDEGATWWHVELLTAVQASLWCTEHNEGEARNVLVVFVLNSMILFVGERALDDGKLGHMVD